MATTSRTKVPNLALSVKQPFAEMIMTGEKKIEYRGKLTKIRGRVYIYATKSPRVDKLEERGQTPDEFDLGVIVGTVEIADCKPRWNEYHWILKNPERLRKPIKPERQPQPVWFQPFDE